MIVKNTVKTFIILLVILYTSYELFDYDFEYLNHNMYDYIALITLFILYGLYLLIPLFNTFSLKKLNKIARIEKLDYKIILNSDGKRMKRMYVKTYYDFIWKEVDYNLTVQQHSTARKARLFAEKFDDTGKLKEWMEKQSQTEKYKIENGALKNDFWSVFIFYICCAAIFSIIMGIYTYDKYLYNYMF